MNPIQNQLEYNSISHINYKPITATSIDNNEGNLNEIIKFFQNLILIYIFKKQLKRKKNKKIK